MVAFDKNTIIAGCTCGCSYMSFKYKYSNLWISIFGDEFYHDQTNCFDLLKKKFKIFRHFILKKDDYIADIILDKKDFKKFVEYLNELYKNACEIEKSPRSYISSRFMLDNDDWKITLNNDDFIHLTSMFEEYEDSPVVMFNNYQYFSYTENDDKYDIYVNKEYWKEFKKLFSSCFPDYLDIDNDESFTPSHFVISYDDDFEFTLSLRVKYELKHVFKNKTHYFLEPSIAFKDFGVLVDKVNNFYKKYKEEI